MRLRSKALEDICRSLGEKKKKSLNQKWPVLRKSFIAQFGLNRHKQIKVLSFGGDCIFQTSWLSVYFLTCHRADAYWFPLLTTKRISGPSSWFPKRRRGLDYDGGEVRLFSSPWPIKACPCVPFLLDQVTKSNAVSEVTHPWRYTPPPTPPRLPFVWRFSKFQPFSLQVQWVPCLWGYHVGALGWVS